MQLNYKSFGQGDPVIILHGMFGTLDNWQTLAKALAEHFSVFIVDQRNHGRSPHSDEFSYTLLAEDLKYFMESQWIFKSHIIGHSMGGKAAMQFALNFPDMVDHLVVVDIGPGENVGNHEKIFEALLAIPLETLQNRRQAEDFLLDLIPEEDVRRFLLKNLSRNKAGGFKWKMNLPVLHREYASILASVEANEVYEGPVQFIRGARSNYIEDEQLPEIRKLFPRAELETIADAGHWVHAQQPQAMLKTLLETLKNYNSTEKG